MIQFNAVSLPWRYMKVYVAGFVLAALLAASLMLAHSPAHATTFTA